MRGASPEPEPEIDELEYPHETNVVRKRRALVGRGASVREGAYSLFMYQMSSLVSFNAPLNLTLTTLPPWSY